MTSVPVLFLALLSPWKIKNGSITNKMAFINNVAYHLISVFYHHLYIPHFFITSTIFCNVLMRKKEHSLLFYFLTWYLNFILSICQISVRVLNMFFYPLHLLLCFKGPD